MTRPHVRAGSPPPCVSSGCNAPQSECLGVCHQINTHCMTKPVVAIKGRVEELPVQMHEPEPKPGVLTTLRSYYRALERRLSKVAP